MIQTLPSFYQEHCISYKQWKKFLQLSPSYNSVLQKLDTDCKKVDACFQRNYKNLLRPTHVLLCRHPSCNVEDMNYLYRFAEINNKTVNKIFKKCSKMLSIQVNQDWLSNTRQTNKFQFMQGCIKTYLALLINNKDISCPICLEENKDEYLCLRCGHVMCLECTLQVAKVDHLHGTWYNKLSNAHHTSCPMCRSPRVLREHNASILYKNKSRKDL